VFDSRTQQHSLIETEKEKYGLTPANEDQFVAALRAQIEA
jgi:hypothetical protein